MLVRYRGWPATVWGKAQPVRESSTHLACPFCRSYATARLYLASLNLDSCVCQACGARWDEDADTGEFRGRSSPSSVLTPRQT